MSTRTCLWHGCKREPAPTVNGIAHAHCADHEALLLREAFGPQSWKDRARAGEMPVMAVGGAPREAAIG